MFLFRLLFCHIHGLAKPTSQNLLDLVVPGRAVAEVATEVQDHVHKGWLLRPLTPGGGKGQRSGCRNTGDIWDYNWLSGPSLCRPVLRPDTPAPLASYAEACVSSFLMLSLCNVPGAFPTLLGTWKRSPQEPTRRPPEVASPG